MFRQVPIRSVLSLSRRTFAEAAKPSADAALVLNFCTPHAPVFKNKQVQKVMLPGEIGEFGITAGHSPLISQLKPGIVTVQHVNGDMEKFFVSGGFSLSHADSVTDVSVGECFALAEFDEGAVKSAYAAATKSLAAAAEGSQEKGVATVEVNLLADLARAINVTL